MPSPSPRRPDITDYTPTDNDLVIGDLHGDSKGLDDLLKVAKYNPDTQRLITVGDNTDRGHDSKVF